METYEILRGLREDRDLTQQDLANLLKIGRTMYRRYETGETEIPVRHLKNLCIFYGISADFLLGLPKGLPYGLSKTK
nr:helix-turn-helix transcriptional regulator [Oscillospiraceae bacterium]